MPLNKKEILYSTLFGWALIVFAAFLAVVILTETLSSGPVVLGTEREADGSIEYLCLGRSCADIEPAGGR
mgnify:CR=1 FL=1